MKAKSIVLVMGLPLSGKTTLGRKISGRTGAHYLDIDNAAQCAPPQEDNPYRSDKARERERKRMIVAYSILHAAVTANLQAGWPLIISATYSRRSNQVLLRQAVEVGGGELKIVWCTFRDTIDEVGRRINERPAKGSIGGCRSVDHYFDDKSRYEETDLPHLKVDTSGNPDVIIEEILAYIEQ